MLGHPLYTRNRAERLVARRQLVRPVTPTRLETHNRLLQVTLDGEPTVKLQIIILTLLILLVLANQTVHEFKPSYQPKSP